MVNEEDVRETITTVAVLEEKIKNLNITINNLNQTIVDLVSSKNR